MATATEIDVTDAAEMQTVLTRYVDSIDGYTQAAAVVSSPDVAASFLAIAERRKKIAEGLASLISEKGVKPEMNGSPEAAAHRWWIRLRVGMSDEEFRSTLAECVRGEKELARTITEAINHGNLDREHREMISNVSCELMEALSMFESVLNQ